MSGALKSVFGGGGIFGALLNVASMMFPPLAIANSLSNLLVNAIGSAVKTAANTLMQEFGMPKFVRDLVNKAVDSVLPGQMKESSPEVDSHVESQAGEAMKQFQKELSDSVVSYASKKMAGEGKSGGKSSAKSWLAAIAEAMGQFLGDKAARMVELSGELTKLNSEGQDLTAQMKGKDQKSSAYGDLSNQKADNAREFNRVQAEFQGTSQEYSILSNTFTNAIKSIGEALTTVGRKG